jgi:hypothetical protein
MIFHSIFLVKSLPSVLFCSIAMYYWHFVISYRDKQNFSVCYRTISPLGNTGKYFTIVKGKVIFPISQYFPTIYESAMLYSTGFKPSKQLSRLRVQGSHYSKSGFLKTLFIRRILLFFFISNFFTASLPL